MGVCCVAVVAVCCHVRHVVTGGVWVVWFDRVFMLYYRCVIWHLSVGHGALFISLWYASYANYQLSLFCFLPCLSCGCLCSVSCAWLQLCVCIVLSSGVHVLWVTGALLFV